MAWWHPDKFEKRKAKLEIRQSALRSARLFFENERFSEAETPALQIMPAADPHIHTFETELLDYDLKLKKTLGLHTSPELDMKKLLVAGAGDIYQICKVYRNAEESSLHHPEFTMLEWYRTNATYEDMMQDCQNLLRFLCDKTQISEFKFMDKTSNPHKEFKKISVNSAFKNFANIKIEKILPSHDIFDTTKRFKNQLQENDITYSNNDNWDDLFFRVMAERIEPNLGVDQPTILYDYPAHMAALSRKKPDDPRYAERFELYICGLEIANAFSELTDVNEQRKRLEEDLRLKQQLYQKEYTIDEEFLRALEYGMPDCAGIALGFDRLVMLMAGADDIRDVLWAPVNTC